MKDRHTTVHKTNTHETEGHKHRQEKDRKTGEKAKTGKDRESVTVSSLFVCWHVAMLCSLKGLIQLYNNNP